MGQSHPWHGRADGDHAVRARRRGAAERKEMHLVGMNVVDRLQQLPHDPPRVQVAQPPRVALQDLETKPALLSIVADMFDNRDRI